MSGKSMSKFPFTATQWQELEHQALIFKYMASGIPIPPDLLCTIKRSHLDSSNSSSLPSKLLISHHPQHVGWNCFQMGLGRKIDPEPGRCRRTDGKKWRCSKEAFPDSKYCERHMHRGKNRSRKPVEVLKTPTSSATITNSTSTLTNSSQNPCSLTPTLTKVGDNCLSSMSLSSDQNRHNIHYYPCYNTNVNAHNVVDQNPSFAYQQSNSTSRPNGVIGLSSSQDSNGSMLLDSDLRRNRYVCGLKEEIDEHAFFSEEPSRTVRGLSNASSMEDSWLLTPLTMSCSSSSTLKQNHDSSYNLQLQSANYSHKHHDHDHHYKQSDHDHQHFDLLGRDLVKLDRREDKTQKTIHFFDEWPMRDKDSSSSWTDLDDKSSNTSGSISTTQLSISMPKSSYEFPIFSSRTHNGE